ncbi:MAG: ABC transporter permease [Gammaproteobacteria bacterium]|nr:ABC transporter permease [Gammaproteobacteria bacterium]
MSVDSNKSPLRVTIRKPVSRTTVILLGVAVWVIFFAAWELAVIFEGVNVLLVPPPETVLATLYELLTGGRFPGDIGISVLRVVGSFAGACVVAVPLGILMGTFAAAESFFNPFVSAWRYLPAPAFIPILLMWLGTGEGPKLALLFIGVVFFLITLVMDYTRQVRIELIETALTLGASQKRVLWTVIVPAVLPNVVVAMRQMLAVSWTYLVIAEIVASTTGIGAMMMRARRFLHTDEIMAGILVIGLLGLLFDLLFRWLHRALFGYLYSQTR